MQKKSVFAYTIAIAAIVILSGAAVTPALSRNAQKAMNATTYQLQSANSSYAYAPQQQVYAGPRYWAMLDRDRLQPGLWLRRLLRQSAGAGSIARSDVQSGMVRRLL